MSLPPHASRNGLTVWRALIAVFGLEAMLFIAAGCHGIGSTSCEGGNPTPSLSSISPTTINSALLPATITVNGSHFLPPSKVVIVGINVGTEYISSNQLIATISTIDSSIVPPGSRVSVHVETPPESFATSIGSGITGCPDGGSSGTVMLTVN